MEGLVVGLNEILDVFCQPKEPTVTISGQLLDELRALPPGKVLHITGKDGRSYVIFDREDFDHVAAFGGMKLSDSADEVRK